MLAHLPRVKTRAFRGVIADRSRHGRSVGPIVSTFQVDDKVCGHIAFEHNAPDNILVEQGSPVSDCRATIQAPIQSSHEKPYAMAR